MDSSWRDHAACRGIDVAIFFDEDDYAPARVICGACAVRADCLKAHIRDEYGMFGGLTPHERRKIKHKYPRGGLSINPPRESHHKKGTKWNPLSPPSLTAVEIG